MVPGSRPGPRGRRFGGADLGRLEAVRPVFRTAPGRFGAGRRSLLARASARGSPLRSLDWVLICAVVALTVLSTLLIWSATKPELAQLGGDPQGFLKKQLLNVLIGFVLLGTVSMLDYRTLRTYAPFAYFLACLGLVAVLTPLGATINGARAWIVIGGGFQVEPSEFVKVTLILVVAVILGELREGDKAPRGRNLIVALAVSLPALGLVMLQPDLSVVIVLAMIIFGMVVVSGTQLRWIGTLLLVTVAVGLFVWRLHLLKQYQIARITAFVHPTANPSGSGYNASQALITIGSGGMFGKGLFHGAQTAGHFVPEQQTDFIFTVAGEELGFVGAIVIIALLGIVLARGLRIAAHADSQFGTMVAAGVVCWFVVQAFINIGMTIGIMPVSGLPLPFVSYGGTATFANMIAVGLLQTVHKRHTIFS
ncbi:MAG: rod shape-determining protein RodA [Micromonosporaceae bacterium]